MGTIHHQPQDSTEVFAMATSLPAWLCQHIVAHTQDAVIFADGAGIIRLWNAGAETIFGYPAAEALGHSLDLIIPEPLRVRHWEGYQRVMATGDTPYAQRLLAVPGIPAGIHGGDHPRDTGEGGRYRGRAPRGDGALAARQGNAGTPRHRRAD